MVVTTFFKVTESDKYARDIGHSSVSTAKLEVFFTYFCFLEEAPLFQYNFNLSFALVTFKNFSCLSQVLDY